MRGGVPRLYSSALFFLFFLVFLNTVLLSFVILPSSHPPILSITLSGLSLVSLYLSLVSLWSLSGLSLVYLSGLSILVSLRLNHPYHLCRSASFSLSVCFVFFFLDAHICKRVFYLLCA